MWSLEEEDKINIKLSDYGISAFATPQGVIGESGTPGFQAPEIRRSCPYDSKARRVSLSKLKLIFVFLIGRKFLLSP